MRQVLISVLNYNNFNATKKCIDSILQFYPDKKNIVIIDNCSEDNSYIKLKKYFINIKIILTEFNGGYAYGHKAALKYAIKNNYECFCILNNDLIIRKNTISSLYSAYKANGLGIYGSITLKSENPDIVNFGGGKTHDITKPFNYNSYEGISLKNYLDEVKFREVQSVEGSSFLIPIKLIEKFGFIREDFFMYGEETDYCYKLKKEGIPSFIVPKSVVVHPGGESLLEKKHLQSYYKRRNMLFFEKEHYGKSIIKNLQESFGILNILKFFVIHFLKLKKKTNLYYLNLANFHALINRKGML